MPTLGNAYLWIREPIKGDYERQYRIKRGKANWSTCCYCSAKGLPICCPLSNGCTPCDFPNNDAAHPAPEVSQQREKTSANLPWLPGKKYLPYLVCAITLCVGIALLQYSFSPLILSITDWSTSQVSDVIGILLTISAACTFAVQTLIVKARKVTPIGMFRTGAIMFSCGFVLFLAPNIWCYGIAMAIVSSGAALLVPAYTSEATSKQPDAPGTVAGYIATSHTIGYGLASLLAFTATLAPIYPIYLGIGCSILIAVITYLLSKNADDSRGSEHCES